MNRDSMMNYILAWEGDSDAITERLDAMTDTEFTEYFETLYNACEWQVPPPDPSELDPLDYGHLTF
ncbi:hypothetical protein LJC32_00900 [Oscillospiraceae bacterium OttesenSCG-928-F05]|nr:hypothetical protein [Oscillospiraceae bacterium OttesenSCG-928-F05]